MKNLELFEKVREDFALDRYNVNIGKNVNDLASGTINMGNMDIGKVETVNGIIFFSIGSENFRVIRIGEGFQTLNTNITYSLTYTSLPGFIEINYFDDKDNRLTLTDQEDTLNLRLVSKVKENDRFLLEIGNINHYAVQDRRIALVSNDKGISYRFFEMYHTRSDIGYSSAPVWEYRVDTFKNSSHNHFRKGQKNYGSIFNGTVEDAKLLIAKNLEQNETFNDINSIETLGETAFVKRLTLKVDNTLAF